MSDQKNIKYPFAKLICEPEFLTRISGEQTAESLDIEFIRPILKKLNKILVNDILNVKLIEPHNYRFNIQVHAQED